VDVIPFGPLRVQTVAPTTRSPLGDNGV
jgi:hypothetical protein